MCLSWLKKLFHKEQSVPPVPKPQIPHPEEARNPEATKQNTSLQAVIDTWLYQWAVPFEYYSFWRSVDYVLVNGLSVPAATYSESKRMEINPQWANPGVLAHENAHISYSFLTEQEKADFRTVFNEEVLVRDSLVQLLYSQNQYMKTSVVECHAECYRFLGFSLPFGLKQFYPKLL